VVNGDQLAVVTGDILYVVPAGGMTGAVTVQGQDTANGNLQFYGNAAVDWVLRDGGSVGEVNARSASILTPHGVIYNVTGLFDYGNNQYLLNIADPVSEFLTTAQGTYGGDQFNW
jgi:hypothetical protein